MSGNVSWQLNESQAVLRCGELAAALDARRPQQGLHDLVWRDQRLSDARLLSLALDPAGGDSLADFYQRGGDLIARYDQTGERPFAVQVYWRASLTSVDNHKFSCCDLLVSVETQLLDGRPVLDAISRLARLAGEMVEGPHYFVARLADSELSYIELYHPDDGLERSVVADESGVQLTTRLFGQPLEKGVILRSRLRGLLVPQANDEAIAGRALDAFVALPPPLTT